MSGLGGNKRLDKKAFAAAEKVTLNALPTCRLVLC